MAAFGVRWSSVIVSAIVVGGLGWSGWRWWEVHRYREAMAEIDDAMRSGRYATAIRDLSALRGRALDPDRAAYLLGNCEKALGRPREADAAWAAIPPDSPLGGRAVAGRMDMLVEQGRFADAERLILQVTEGLGPRGSALRMLLIPTFVQEGRADEAERLIEARWRGLEAAGEATTEQAVNLARLHMEMRWNVAPVETLREYLDQVARLAPDDDRIRLGRANLAIRAGSYDEAAHFLDECLRRRPDDRPVWRARLDWAMRTARLDEVRTALGHLPADPANPAEAHRISAWIASRCGDGQREREALAALVAEAPEDLEALARLEKVAPPADADGLRRRRAEIERDRSRYRELYRRHQPARDAEEMARLAERLGHPFEAILWLTAAMADEPDRTDLRADRRRLEPSAAGPGVSEGSLLEIVPAGCGG